MKKRILMLCSSDPGPLKDLSHKALGYETIIDSYTDISQEGDVAYIHRRIDEINSGKISFDGIIGVNEHCALLAHVIAQETGLIICSSQSLLACQNKYISRLVQKECVPEHIPAFFLSDEYEKSNYASISFPLFMKPVRGFLSFCSREVKNKEDFRKLLNSCVPKLRQENHKYAQVLSLAEFSHRYRDTYNQFMIESIITGRQVTLDGYIFEKEINFFGIVESHFLPDTLSFSRFDFPYSFGKKIDAQVYQVATRLIQGIGLNNTLFNIEFMIDEFDNNIQVVEVHARPSSQFLPLIYVVTGYNPLQIAYDIATGTNPENNLSQDTKKYACASCCILRQKHDAYVQKIPSQDQLDTLKEQFPDVQIVILARPGTRLSDYTQDEDTFRYGYINIPGSDVREVKTIFGLLESKLDFVFV